MENESGRQEFLFKMYDQMFNDINTHILVVWQSVGVVVGAFALLALVEKNIISFDIGTSLILLICGWLLANIIDASYWYNRNLVIIANIERQFLRESDLMEIHYYFGKHRPKNRMITHLKIQVSLGISIALIVIIFHFISRVVPGAGLSFSNFLERTLPYVVLVAISIYLLYLWRDNRKSYAEFISNSPGKKIDTSGITYGIGHGFRKNDNPSKVESASLAESNKETTSSETQNK